MGWFLSRGQFFLPRGRDESNLVLDPLTLKLGETRAVAGALAFAQGGVFGSVYALPGARGGTLATHTIDAWGTELGITGKPGGYPLTLAIGYLSDMGNDYEPDEGFEEPDEIWFEPGRRGGQDKLYYFSRFEVSRRGLLSCIAVFGREQGAEGYWLGRTDYAATQDGYVERKGNREIIDGQMRHRRRE